MNPTLRANLTLPVIVGFALMIHVTLPVLFGDYASRIATDMGLAIMLAVSLNIVNGFTGQFSIGHAAFYAIGAYAAGLVTYYASLIIWHQVNVQTGYGNIAIQQSIYVIACIFGGLVAGLVGLFVGLPSLRLRGDYLAIVTLGVGEILRILLQQTNKQIDTFEDLKSAKWSELFPPPVGGSLGFSGIPKMTNVFWVYVFAGLTLLFAFRLKRSTFGRAMLSVRENEIAAEAMGVNITRTKVWAFIFAAGWAGVAGGLYAHQPGTILQPINGGFQQSFDIIIMVVLGGLGSISGATLAAILPHARQCVSH